MITKKRSRKNEHEKTITKKRTRKNEHEKTNTKKRSRKNDHVLSGFPFIRRNKRNRFARTFNDFRVSYFMFYGINQLISFSAKSYISDRMV